MGLPLERIINRKIKIFNALKANFRRKIRPFQARDPLNPWN
jgi:hypothetical protein